MRHVAPESLTDWRTEWAQHARFLRGMARQYLADALAELDAGKRERASRYFNEWRTLHERARWYGKAATR